MGLHVFLLFVHIENEKKTTQPLVLSHSVQGKMDWKEWPRMPVHIPSVMLPLGLCSSGDAAPVPLPSRLIIFYFSLAWVVIACVTSFTDLNECKKSLWWQFSLTESYDLQEHSTQAEGGEWERKHNAVFGSCLYYKGPVEAHVVPFQKTNEHFCVTFL